MKLCDTCGTWDMKPGSGCKECARLTGTAKPFSGLHRVYPPPSGWDGRTPPKTARQQEDDR